MQYRITAIRILFLSGKVIKSEKNRNFAIIKKDRIWSSRKDIYGLTEP